MHLCDHLRCSKQTPLTLVALLLVTGLSGCSLMPGAKSAGLADAEPRVESRGTYMVEVRLKRDPDVHKFEIVGHPTINDALEQAKVAGRVNLALLRTDPKTNRRHKMVINYDSKQDRVPYEYDYELLPNDHLIVTRSTASPLDTLFGDSLGALSTY